MEPPRLSTAKSTTRPPPASPEPILSPTASPTGTLPGAQIVDITTPQTFTPLALDNGLTYVDSGTEHITIHDGSFGLRHQSRSGRRQRILHDDRSRSGADHFDGRRLPDQSVPIQHPARARQRRRQFHHRQPRLSDQRKRRAPEFAAERGKSHRRSAAGYFRAHRSTSATTTTASAMKASSRLPMAHSGLSDEYGPFLTHHDASGKIIERVKPLPRSRTQAAQRLHPPRPGPSHGRLDDHARRHHARPASCSRHF